MMEAKQKFNTVDEYLAIFPQNIKDKLDKLRLTIKKTAPEEEEIISYNMPAFTFHGILVYFAAHKKHIGFYPGNDMVNKVFKDELSSFETSKGTIKFPNDREIPLNLVVKIVQYKMNENMKKSLVKNNHK